MTLWQDINSRWDADGASSYDPKPTLAHHLLHMLGASLVAVVGTDENRLGIWWGWVAMFCTVVSIGVEYAQTKGWIGKQKAGLKDSQFDAYQYQIHWIWYSNIYLGLLLFAAFSFGYFQLLRKWVKPKDIRFGSVEAEVE